MFKKYYSFLGIMMIGLLACNDTTNTANQESDYEVTVTSATSETVKSVASISIDGMMCEMACGGKIKKELSQLNGVKVAEIEFHEGEPTDKAIVEFDPATTDANKLASCVNGIADGLYSVRSVEVVNYSTATENSTTGTKKTGYFWEKDFTLPNLTHFLPHW